MRTLPLLCLLSLAPRAPAGQNMMVGLGWHRMTTAADTIVWHNGGTGGFRTFAGLVPATGRGIVLMANTGGAGADDIAFHLLNPALPLAPPARQAVDVPPEVLARYVGTYELAPQFSIEVTLVDGTLRAQATGQPVTHLLYQGDHEFRVVELPDAQGLETPPARRDPFGKGHPGRASPRRPAIATEASCRMQLGILSPEFRVPGISVCLVATRSPSPNAITVFQSRRIPVNRWR